MEVNGSRMSDPGNDEFRDGMPFFGGRLWLDFVNTAPVSLGDLIATPAGLARWLAAAELRLPDGGADAALVAEAARLREALRELRVALSARAEVPAEALAVVDGHLARSLWRPRLVVQGGGIVVEDVDAAGADPLAAVAADFADFAAHFEPSRLRRCANDACVMVFYDKARNGTRRWCSMAVCGNRHKVAAHRARQQP